MIVAGFRWPDWRHVEGSVLEPWLDLWAGFLLRGSGSSPSFSCRKRESGLDSMNSGGSFWKGKTDVTGGGTYMAWSPQPFASWAWGRSSSQDTRGPFTCGNWVQMWTWMENSDVGCLETRQKTQRKLGSGLTKSERNCLFFLLTLDCVCKGVCIYEIAEPYGCTRMHVFSWSVDTRAVEGRGLVWRWGK